MPLLLTTPAPILTTIGLPVPRVYAVLARAAYEPLHQGVGYELAYYVSLEAKQAGALPLRANELPNGFFEACSPEQAAVLPPPAYWEGQARAELLKLLPDGTVLDVL